MNEVVCFCTALGMLLTIIGQFSAQSSRCEKQIMVKLKQLNINIEEKVLTIHQLILYAKLKEVDHRPKYRAEKYKMSKRKQRKIKPDSPPRSCPASCLIRTTGNLFMKVQNRTQLAHATAVHLQQRVGSPCKKSHSPYFISEETQPY